MRKPTVDKAVLEMSRLEKRLTRLTQVLASLPLEQIQSGASKLWSISWQNDQRKAAEQTIVSWQDDASVLRCPFCQQDFSSYSFRRHHCRTCGQVVCGDPVTGCSSEVPLSIAPRKFSFIIAHASILTLGSLKSNCGEVGYHWFNKCRHQTLQGLQVNLVRSARFRSRFDAKASRYESLRKPDSIRERDPTSST